MNYDLTKVYNTFRFVSRERAYIEGTVSIGYFNFETIDFTKVPIPRLGIVKDGKRLCKNYCGNTYTYSDDHTFDLYIECSIS